MRLAADGTPWFPPLTEAQRTSLRRRSLIIDISFDPEIAGYPQFDDMVAMLNEALRAAGKSDMFVAGVRGSTKRMHVQELRYKRDGSRNEWANRNRDKDE